MFSRTQWKWTSRLWAILILRPEVFRDQNKDVVLRTVRALVQGRRWAKDPKNREQVLKIYNRYLPSSEPSFMDHLYRKNVEPIPLYPYTNIEELRIFLSYLTGANPTLRRLKLTEFVDNSFLKRWQEASNQPKLDYSAILRGARYRSRGVP